MPSSENSDSSGRATLQAKHVYEATWRQPEDVDRWIRQQCEGRVLNLCSGESPIGDVQVDADPDRDPDVVADMCNLPFQDASFDTIVFDPPWKLGYYKRMTPFFEAVRVLKPDGLLLMNALWIGESENTVIDGDPVVRPTTSGRTSRSSSRTGNSRVSRRFRR